MSTTVQVPVPVQAPPLHPVNTLPDAAAGVSVTLVPDTKFVEQVAPQLMPDGVLVTVPLPVPVFVTDSENCGAGENVAPTVTAEVPMVKLQDPVPEHGPLHPANTDRFEAGEAVKVTALPLLIAVVLAHVPEVEPEVTVQLMLPVPVTLPLPVPAPVTVTVVELKVAVTDFAAVIVTEQAPVPVQAPPQPAKDVPAGALAMRDTDVPLT